MAMVVRFTAGSKSIIGDGRQAARVAEGKGGSIGAESLRFLVPPLAEADAAEAELHRAEAAETVARSALETVQSECRVYIHSVSDDLSALVRHTRNNIFVAQVFPDGFAAYTDVEANRKPMLMEVLMKQLAVCKLPELSDEQRQAMITGTQTRRQKLVDAMTKHTDCEVALMVAETTYRAAARGVHVGLRLFKQALSNLGLTNAQIFEIIPDATPTPKTPGSSDNGGSSPTPAPTPKAV